MFPVVIQNIVVGLPYEPHAGQVEYLTKIVDCLQTRKCGVLEAPRGIGKTLSLLCAAFAWLKTQDPAKFSIIYASHTYEHLVEALTKFKQSETQAKTSLIGVCTQESKFAFAEDVDVIFTLYVNLMDPKYRRAPLDFTNKVVILDDAQNVGKLCEEWASTQIKLSDIEAYLKQLTVTSNIESNNLHVINDILLGFQAVLDEITPRTYNGDYIYEICQKIGITSSNWRKAVSLCDEITGLRPFADFVQVVFFNSGEIEEVTKRFKVHFAYDAKSSWRSQKNSKDCVLSFWCCSPRFGVKMLTKFNPHCVIITSATLAPLEPLIKELNLDVCVKHVSSHIIDCGQVSAIVCTHGPDNVELNCNFHNRGLRLYNSIGLTLCNIMTPISGDICVFFASHALMVECQELWQNNGTWHRLAKIREISIDDKTYLNETINCNFKTSSSPGALFIGVCHQQLPENLNWGLARAVFLIGVPYPPREDIHVKLKEQCLDQTTYTGAGRAWFNLEAIRATNATIGRLIRHENDYGAIVLMDSRYSNPNLQKNITAWLRNLIIVEKYPGTMKCLSRFFHRNAAKKRKNTNADNVAKKPKIIGGDEKTVNNNDQNSLQGNLKGLQEFILMVETRLDDTSFQSFIRALTVYRIFSDFDDLTSRLDDIFLPKKHHFYLVGGIASVIKDPHKQLFHDYCNKSI